MPAVMPEAKEAGAGRRSLPTTASLAPVWHRQARAALPLIAVPNATPVCPLFAPNPLACTNGWGSPACAGQRPE